MLTKTVMVDWALKINYLSILVSIMFTKTSCVGL